MGFTNNGSEPLPYERLRVGMGEPAGDKRKEPTRNESALV